MKQTCIYHSRDLDGWMSAAIVKRVYPDVVLIGWDYGNELPSIPNYDMLIMVDISFPVEVMKDLNDGRMIWIDHHISAIDATANEFISPAGIRDITMSACELTWLWFYPGAKMPELVRLLGRYDCFGHKGTEEEVVVLHHQYGARTYIKNPEDALDWLMKSKKNPLIHEALIAAGHAVYAYLCTEAKQIYNRRFDITMDTRGSDDRDWTVSDRQYKFACVNQERFNPVNFGIDYHADGYDGFACFWYQDGKFTYSLYNDNGLVDCSIIAKSRGGGGHRGASGFRSEIILK